MRSARRQNRGIAAVELALVLPLFLTLLVGVWEVGRLIEMHNIVSNSAREGARAAASAKLSNSECQTVAKTYLIGNNIPTSNVTVVISNVTSGGDVKDAEQLDKVRCTVTLPFKDVSWVILNFFVTNSSLVRSTVDWRSMADKPLTVDSELPKE